MNYLSSLQVSLPIIRRANQLSWGKTKAATHLGVAVVEGNPGVLAVRPVLRRAAAQQRLAQDLLVLPLGLRRVTALFEAPQRVSPSSFAL